MDHLKMSREDFQAEVEEFKAKLRLVNSEPKPLAGTAVTGLNQHQYVRLAIVATKEATPRHFVLFVESNWLHDKIHDVLRSPEWLKNGWDNKWNYIEELKRKPLPGDTLNDYTEIVPSNVEWVALFEFLMEQGAAFKAAKLYKDKSYGLPQED